MNLFFKNGYGIACDRCGETFSLGGRKAFANGKAAMEAATGQGWKLKAKSLFHDMCPRCARERTEAHWENRQVWQDKIKLKPCPWCNGKLLLMDKPMLGGLFIECYNKDCPFIYEGPYKTTKNRVIAAWNRKSIDGAIEATVAKNG